VLNCRAGIFAFQRIPNGEIIPRAFPFHFPFFIGEIKNPVWHRDCISFSEAFEINKRQIMKKKAICLMIACLSLFAYPGMLNAGTAVAADKNTETVIPPHLTPALEKKVTELKKHHPDIFKKDKSAADASDANGGKRDGGVLIISGGALLLIIILLIILL
jgi:hypothetical protein